MSRPSTETTSGGTRLFIDSRVVDSTTNIETVLGHVTKERSNPLFGEDQPWEVRYDNLYANVIHDGNRYRMWYNPFIIDDEMTDTPLGERQTRTYQPKRREMAICYAESSDGLHWTKPELGIEEFDGNRNNNIVLRNIHGAGVFHDPADPDPSRRFKVLQQDGAATSPDGLHWTRHATPGIDAVGDTHNCLIRDSSNRYVGFTRLWDGGQRVVARTTSDDFAAWTPAVGVMQATEDALHRQTYALIPFEVHGLYAALVMVLDTETDLVDTELAISHDTNVWERVAPGQPLIPRGEPGEFDYGCIYGAAYPLERDDSVLLYYGGSDDTHGSWRAASLGLAYLQRDRYAGLRAAGDEEGSILIHPLRCTGTTLRINADAAGGSVRVGIENSDDRTIAECTPITTDGQDTTVNWGATDDLSQFAGQDVRLRFELRNATVYSFEFGTGT
jgi:hypothetical protein